MHPLPRPLFRMPARVATALAIAGVLAFALTLTTSHPEAQATGPEFYVGKNVDTVGPYKTSLYDPRPVQAPGEPPKAPLNPFFLGDPDKKQQNESSCDINPVNPQIVFCGMNDYSAVDRADIVGNRWVRAAFSLDGGLTWKSQLVPGFQPEAPDAPAPLVTPLGYSTAADPVVRTVPGAAFYSFIAFNPDGNGALFFSRWFERSIEGGFPYGWKDTKEIARGTGSPGSPGRFLDRESMAISLLSSGTPYTLTGVPVTPDNASETRTVTLPPAVVHVAYAVLVGNDQQEGTKLTYRRSTNYGDSFEPATTLSEAQSVNQGADIATDSGGRVLVVWRRFGRPTYSTSKDTDAIMAALSLDYGRSFGRAKVIANICPFTQVTSSYSFRAQSHAAAVFDGTTFHVVWADRGKDGASCSTTGYSQIVRSSLNAQGQWSSPTSVAPATGHQFFPSIAAAGTTVLASWYDTQRDEANGVQQDKKANVYDYVFDRTDGKKVRRRAADIFAAQAASGWAPAFGSAKRVSSYMTGIFGDREVELQRNNVNNRMFQDGKVPFNGDYQVATGVKWVLVPDTANDGQMKWVSSAGQPSAQPVFQLAWTDNRFVRGNVTKVDPTTGEFTGASAYTPPPPTQTSSEGDSPSTTQREACSAVTAATRDQTVISARLYPSLMIGSSSASKPTVRECDLTVDPECQTTIRRAYTIFVKNSSTYDKEIRLSIGDLAPGTVASFAKDGEPITELPRDTDTEEVANPTTGIVTQVPTTSILLPKRSSTSRTIYVTSPSSLPLPAIPVTATEVSPGSLVVTTYLNGNPYPLPLEDVWDPSNRITDLSVEETEDYTPVIAYRSSSVIEQPSVDEPSVDEPSVDEPSVDEPSVDEPSVDEPSVDEPSVDEASLDDGGPGTTVSLSNTRDPETGSGFNSTEKLTQVTWKVKLSGNTSTSMSSKLFINAPVDVVNALNRAKTQLLVSRRYRTNDIRQTTTGPCAPVFVSSYQVIANITKPVFTNDATTPPDAVNPPRSQPSFTIPPGSAVFMTLRVWGDVPGFAPGRLGLSVQSQPDTPLTDFDDTLVQNGAPSAADVSATTSEDTAVNLIAGGSDPDLDPLTFKIVDQPSHGSVTVNPNGSIRYTPEADYSGPDSFTFNVNDGTVDSANAATASINVTPVNDAPVAQDGALATDEDTANSGALNASDVDGPSLTFSLVSGPTKGTLAFGATGAYTYTPDPNVSGADSFTFKASDGTLESNVATVAVTISAVNDEPAARDDSATTLEDTAGTIAVLTNDGDVDGNALTVTAVSTPAQGTATLNADGTITYTPAPNYYGPDSFTYTISDGNGGSASATVGVNVTSVNDEPVAVNDVAIVTEDSGANEVSVLANDSTAPDDGETMTVTAVTQGTSGTVAFTATGVSYTPNANFNGTDSFTYTIGDGNGGTATAAVSITVTAVNDPPVPVVDTKATVKNGVLTFPASDLTANDGVGAGESGQTLTVTGANSAVNGTVALAGGSVTFTPALDFVGTASFSYTVCDNGTPSACATGNVTVTVFASYGFNGLLSPWRTGVRHKMGSTFQIVWQYTAPGTTTPIDSSNARPQLLAYGPFTTCKAVGTPIDPLWTNKVVDDPGSSSFQWNLTTKTWQYNWQPRNLAYGCYMVYVKSQTSGQVNGGFDITLTR